MAGGGGEGAVYDGCSVNGKPTQKGDFLDEVIAERAEKNPKFDELVEDKYVELLRKRAEDARADADHRALVNADLLRKLESAKNREESLELVLLCAQDIVDGWPALTFRTIGGMTKKVDTLKQALEFVKR